MHQGEAAPLKLESAPLLVERDTPLTTPFAANHNGSMADDAPDLGISSPSPARTHITLVVGGNDHDAVDFYKFALDTPVAESFKFLSFEIGSDNARVERSALLGAILNPCWASPNSTTVSDLTTLHTLNFLEYELKTTAVKRILRELDVSGVFATVYRASSDWEEAASHIIGGLQNLEALALKPGD